jgi:hypothetical protein
VCVCVCVWCVWCVWCVCMYVYGKLYCKDRIKLLKYLNFILPSLQYHLPHTYTLPPDDGLLMPETCRGTLIQQTNNKQCIELVIIHIILYFSLFPIRERRCSTITKTAFLFIACNNYTELPTAQAMKNLLY